MTSRLVPIPEWDPSGFLPPFLESPVSGESRSPYRVRLTDLVLRFGDTTDRRSLLGGLLGYRAALHTAGLRDGFQWVNGSFVEDTTRQERREPNDIDVVTYFRTPEESTQDQLVEANPDLFHPAAVRRQYQVDAYTVALDTGNQPYLVRVTAYWNNLWSHDRDRHWKGYLEIDLSDDEDAAARAILREAASREVEG